MTRLWKMGLAAALTLGLTGMVQAAEKIDGYEVVSTEESGVSQEVTDLESGLGRLVDLGPLELGAAEEDHLVLHLFFRLVDAVPISGKVHKIKFQDLKLNEVAFSIPQFDDFEIPSTPPYEIEDPLVVKAAYSDIAMNMLREMLEPNYTFVVTGKMQVFGKFRINRRNKKYVVPVNIHVELRSDTIANSEYRDAVADQIFEILKGDLLSNLEDWRSRITEPADGGETAPEGEAVPEAGTETEAETEAGAETEGGGE